MPDYEFIRYEQHDRVARLVLNRPQYRNAQSWRLTEELDNAFEHASKDNSIGAIVLAGEGDQVRPAHDGVLAVAEV